MLSPSPAVRALLIGIVVVTFTILGATVLSLNQLSRQAETHLRSELQARSATLAAALVTEAGQTGDMLRAVQPVMAAEWSSTLALLDASGRVFATSDRDLTQSIGWTRMMRDGVATDKVFRGREGYLVAIHPVGTTGYSVAALASAEQAEVAPEQVWNVALWAAALWGLLVGCMAVMAWYAGSYTATQLERLGARIAEGDADPEVLIRHGHLRLGTMADVFTPMAHKMTQAWASVAQGREHIRALYQVNPHYVLLCSLDGRIIEANPAFYAVTGLSLEAFKAGPVELLDDIFPIGPLQEMAQRSLREACSIQGIEYGIIGQDGEARAVLVSLRAFALDGEDVVIIQATDISARRTMEQRIHAFNDTLDLMVDQRVAQLTAGQRSIRRTLDSAGLVLASFDTGGGTRRWSGGARALTGRTVGQVPHFSSVTSAFGLADVERSAFTAWFWGDEDTPFLAEHGVAGEEGAMRLRRFVWHKSRLGERDDLRTVIGLELPVEGVEDSPLRPLASRADAIAPEGEQGDGQPGYAPLPDSAFGRGPKA